MSNDNHTALEVRTRRYGDAYGLRVTFNIYKDDYLGLLGDRPGVRYVVHNPHERPLPGSDGYVAGAGQ